MLKRASVPAAIFAVLVVIYLVAQATGWRQDGFKGSKPTVELVYVEWEGAKAAAHVMKAVIEEQLGYPCEVIPVGAAAMWQSVATGDADAMLAAWLPVTHAQYYRKLQHRVVDLGPTLEGARIGLVVPGYVTIDSIAQLPEHAERFNHRIVGIDPGAGLMNKTEEAMLVYDLESFELVSSSGAAMTAQLGDAIRSERWIVVTGWTPHWVFTRYDLKFLNDPRGVYGAAEKVHTIVRTGLREDMPKVYRVLDRFHWTMQEIGQLIEQNQEPGADPYETARQWVRDHPEQVNQWVGGDEGQREGTGTRSGGR